MGYKALYRKYRPRHFRDVIGQDHVVRTLINAVKQNKTGHAYLFSGPRGTGKTTVARILARVINCSSPVNGEPCDTCPRCSGADEGLGVLEIDAASHGSVEDIRQLVAQVSLVPLSGGMMVYIIDEVHMLSKEAFNAFLKTLEEPPPHAVFVLATTEPGKLLATIHSRCQHFAFKRVPLDLVIEHIKQICSSENIPAEDGAVRLIARAGDGSVRDSISILEQAVAFEPDGLTLKGVREVLGIPDRVNLRLLAGNIINNEPGSIISAFESIIERGQEPGPVLNDLISHFRDLLFVSLKINAADLATLPEEEKKIIDEQVKNISASNIHSAISYLAKIESQIKYQDEGALILEASLLRLANLLNSTEEALQPFPQKRRMETTPQPTESAKYIFPEDIQKRQDVQPTSLTGGLTLKRKKTTGETSAQVSEPAKIIPPPKLEIPADIEPFWRDTLEAVRELSVHEYILLAEATPSPPPSKWQTPDPTGPPLDLVLIYPQGRNVIVKMLNEPVLLDRLETRLSEVLERKIKLRILREREQTDSSSLQKTGADSRESSRASAVLFEISDRPVPSDPELKQIHNLIVDDFPDYQIEQH